MRRLVIADVHANRPALEAVLEDAPDWDELLFLGDAVDYGPHPNAVVDRLVGLPGTFIEGNHDRSVVEDGVPEAPPGRAGFTQWTRGELTEQSRAFLEELEDTAVVSTPRGDVRAVHGDFDEQFPDLALDRRLRLTTDMAAFEAVGAAVAEPVVMFGHSHRQFELSADGTRFVNPGSVGRSASTGLGAEYALLEDGRVDLRSTDYDATPTVATMEELPIDESPTVWRRCLERDLLDVRRTVGTRPDREAVAAHGRYGPAQYDEEFGSLVDALRAAGFHPDGR